MDANPRIPSDQCDAEIPRFCGQSSWRIGRYFRRKGPVSRLRFLPCIDSDFELRVKQYRHAPCWRWKWRWKRDHCWYVDVWQIRLLQLILINPSAMTKARKDAGKYPNVWICVIHALDVLALRWQFSARDGLHLYALLRLIDKLNRKHLKMYLKEHETQIRLAWGWFCLRLTAR